MTSPKEDNSPSFGCDRCGVGSRTYEWKHASKSDCIESLGEELVKVTARVDTLTSKIEKIIHDKAWARATGGI